MPFSFKPRPDDHDPEGDARRLGVDKVYYADLPDWWCRLTAPFALSWRREAAVLLALPLAGFALGVLVGVRLGA